MQDHRNNAYEAFALFLSFAQSDARLSCTHMSLYFVLFGHWLEHDGQCSFQVSRRKLMGPAHMSIATFHKVIKELHTFGYLTYQPSYHPGKGSTVTLHFKPQNISM